MGNLYYVINLKGGRLSPPISLNTCEFAEVYCGLLTEFNLLKILANSTLAEVLPGIWRKGYERNN